jgi:hypothetical protein
MVPVASAGAFVGFLREAPRTVVSGIRHFFGGWVYLAFLLALCLLGGPRVGIRLATAFFSAQVGAVVLGSLLGIRIGTPVASLGIAVAALLLAREAMRPTEERRQLAGLAALAGVVHGLGIVAVASLPSENGGPGILDPLLFVLGMDAALLISTTVVSGVGRVIPGRLARAPWPGMAAVGVGGVAFAAAFAAQAGGPSADATDAVRRLQLPGILSPSGGAAPPGSRRVTLNAPDAPVQCFLAVEAFEIRQETLVRLKDVADLIGLESRRELGVEDQAAVKERLRELVVERTALTIDGETRPPVSRRVDFMTVDDRGALPRPKPVPEDVETAQVGVTAVYLTKATARDLSLRWESFDLAGEIPATVTDPESTRSILLTPEQPGFAWKNELVEDPVPTVAAIAVDPTELTVPVWSLLPLLAAVALVVAAIRRRRAGPPLALARVTLVIAVLLAPLGNLAIALPASVGSTPGADQAKRILSGVLPSIYRALAFREESAAYDRLALSVTGDTMTEVYLEHRRGLEMEERGGARVRVEAVEVVEVGSVEADGSGGFSARTTWTVGGTVTHFGHRHFRQNRYEAQVSVVNDEGVWKIRSIEVENEERLR